MKKIISVLGIILFVLLTLSACKIGGDGAGDSSDGQQGGSLTDTDGSSDIQQSQKTLNIIVGNNISPSIVSTLYGEVSKRFDGKVEICYESVAEGDYEIIIGRTDRALTKSAYRRLEKTEREALDIGYVIYSNTRSTALAFDEKLDSSCGVQVAIEKYIELLPENDVCLPGGVVAKDTVDLIKWQTERDTAERDEEWDAIAAGIGGELGVSVVEAAKSYYSMITQDLVVWMANLYDPETGAFYYSNSGRNTVGFGPDIESTEQALDFLACTGAFAGIGNSAKNIPDCMKEALLEWLKPLQDPNGYFYHPQWSKRDVDNQLSRRGRDLDRAIKLLDICGAKPTYDTITGVKGDYTLIDGSRVDSEENLPISKSALSTPLGNYRVEAVSKIVGTSVEDSNITPTLRTEKNFRAYLASLDIRGDSYWVGNQLSSQATQFKNREEQLRASGADWSLVEILEEWLLENQNEKNGLWYYIEKGDPKYSIYDGVNGLLKISALYNTLGMEFHYPLEAIESAIEGIYTDEVAETVCYAYNTWFAVDIIINNVNKFSKDSLAASKQMEKIRQTLLEDAPNSIAHTRDKVLSFIKDDGSFSYMPNETASNSQGMPVAVPGTNEGDINGTVICAYGTHGYMFNVLGIDAPDPYGLAEWYLFISTLEELGPIVKDEMPIAEKKVLTFERDEIGSQPEDLDYYINSTGDFAVSKDPRGASGSKNVFNFDSKAGGGDTIKIPCETSVKTSCSVFEGDFCFLGGTSAYSSQILLENIYMLGFKISGDNVVIIDSSSQGALREENSYGLKVKIGEWWNLRVEYYNGDHSTVRIKVFINDELAWVTDNYYDYHGTKLLSNKGTPSDGFEGTSIVGISWCDVNILMDNLSSYKTNDTYEPMLDPDNQPLYFNVDDPLKEEESGGSSSGDGTDVDGLGDGEYFSGTTYIGSRFDYSASAQLNTIEWSPNDPTAATTAIENGHLVFDKTNASDYDEYIFWNLLGATYNSGDPVIFETDVKFSTTVESGKIGCYSVRNGSGIWHEVDVSIKDGKIDIGGVGALDPDTWYNIRIASEIDTASNSVTVRVYVNGEDVGVAEHKIASANDFYPGKAHYYIAAADDGSVSFDNVYFGYGQTVELGKGKYFNDTKNYGTLVRNDYENGRAQGLYEDQGICSSKVVDGVNRFQNLDVSGESDVTEYIVFDSYELSSDGCSTFVFEADYFVAGSWYTRPDYLFRVFGYEFNLGSDVWPNTAIYIPYGGAEIVLNTWYNLRVEITKTATSGSFTVDVYLDGVLKVDNKAVTGTLSGSTKTLISMPATQGGNVAMYFDNVAYGYCK